MNVLLLVAAVLFFLSAVGANLIPNETAWGLFFLALGLAITSLRLAVPWGKE